MQKSKMPAEPKKPSTFEVAVRKRISAALLEAKRMHRIEIEHLTGQIGRYRTDARTVRDGMLHRYRAAVLEIIEFYVGDRHSCDLSRTVIDAIARADGTLAGRPDAEYLQCIHDIVAAESKINSIKPPPFARTLRMLQDISLLTGCGNSIVGQNEHDRPFTIAHGRRFDDGLPQSRDTA